VVNSGLKGSVLADELAGDPREIECKAAFVDGVSEAHVGLIFVPRSVVWAGAAKKEAPA
jgi:hypothetical protein